MANKGTVKKGHSVNTRVMAPFDSDPTYDEMIALLRREPVIGDWYFNTAVTTPEYISAIDGSNNLTWVSLNSSALTLDGVFDNGKVIDGASSYGNSMRVGTAADELCIYVTGGNVVMSTLTGDAADITIAPDGGDTHVTGTLDVSGAFTSTGNLTVGATKLVVTAATGAVSSAAGFTSTATSGNVIVVNTNKFLVAADTGNTTIAGDLAVTGAASIGTLYLDGVSPSAAATTLALNGKTTGGVSIGATSTGAITLGAAVNVAASKAVTVAGVAGSNMLVMTAGDAVLSDGSLSITDNDNAAALAVVNDTITSAALATLSSSSLTTGKGLSITAVAATSGSLVYLEAAAATLTGKYIQCYDGAADDFSVGRYGTVTIAGNAIGTDSLVLTTGDLQVTAGFIDVDQGYVTVDTTSDYASYFKRNRTGANTSPVLTVEATHTGEQNAALAVVGSMTGAYTAVTIAYAGTADGLKITTSDVAGTALEVVCAASTTDSMIKVDGSTGNWVGATGVGMLNLVGDGTLAHANASMLNIAFSGTTAATAMGSSVRIVDTGTDGGAASYAVYLSSANTEALYVATGKAKFAETVDLDTGLTFTVSGLVVTQDATNTFIDAGSANENIVIGSITATDFQLCGVTATDSAFWVAATATMTFSENAIGVFTGTGTGFGLVIPSHATAAPNAAAAAGSIFFEIDAKKLWVNFNGGAGDWVSVTLA